MRGPKGRHPAGPGGEPSAQLTPAGFLSTLSALGVDLKAPLAVAVSGGPDSAALLYVACASRGEGGPPVHAITVDHGLRAAAASEAQLVAAWCQDLHVPHTVLRWEGEPQGNLQAAARQARYGLMARWCRDEGVSTLLTAHHLNDQAETVLQRLARGSGVDGLAGMAPVRWLSSPEEGPPVRLVRPFLDVPKTHLIALADREGLAWAEDPSNRDAQFERARLRAAAPLLDGLGLTPERVAGTADWMGLAVPVLEAAADRLAQGALHQAPFGSLSLNRAVFRDNLEETRLRVLARVLCALSGRAYRPRLRALAMLDRALCERGEFVGATLGGCRFVGDGAPETVRIVRELRACREANPPSPAPSRPILWDGRWMVRPLGGFRRSLSLRPLGPDGLEAVRSTASDDAAPLRALREALAGRRLDALAAQTLPSVWDGDRLVDIASADAGRQTTRAALVSASLHASFFAIWGPATRCARE